MTNDDIVTRLRRIGTISDCEVAADEIERLRHDLHESRLAVAAMRSARDQARRAWCLYLSANTGLPKERIADLNGYGDCFDRTPNDIEAHEIRGDLAGGTQ